jgi:CRP-like cAMP-binding protein
MKEYFEILSKYPLFNGIEPENIENMLICLNGKTMEIAKGNPIFLEGDPAQFVGIVLSGMVQIVQEDYYGNRSVLTVLSPGEMFAEAFSCAGLQTMPVSVMALKNSTILLLDCRKVLTVCSNTCQFHSKLITNLLQGISRKNLALNQKIRFMSQKTTKEKLMAYLSAQAKQQGSPEFTIPYDRQSLADYLGVERSAMSAEIGKLKREGLIDSKGKWFCLKAR